MLLARSSTVRKEKKKKETAKKKAYLTHSVPKVKVLLSLWTFFTGKREKIRREREQKKGESGEKKGEKEKGKEGRRTKESENERRERGQRIPLTGDRFSRKEGERRRRKKIHSESDQRGRDRSLCNMLLYCWSVGQQPSSTFEHMDTQKMLQQCRDSPFFFVTSALSLSLSPFVHLLLFFSLFSPFLSFFRSCIYFLLQKTFFLL